MLGMGKPVHIFQLEQVWKKWLIWLPLLLLMLKSRRKKMFLLKSTYSIGSAFINYKNNLYLDKIQINQMIAHLQGKLVKKHQHMLLLIVV
jgi:hypothetical protein